MVKEECSNLEWTIDCFMLTLFSVIAIICCHIFIMCFVYKEPPSKGLVGSEKDLTQTQDITAGMKSTHIFCAALKQTTSWFCVQVGYITEPLIKIH